MKHHFVQHILVVFLTLYQISSHSWQQIKIIYMKIGNKEQFSKLIYKDWKTSTPICKFTNIPKLCFRWRFLLILPVMWRTALKTDKDMQAHLAIGEEQPHPLHADLEQPSLPRREILNRELSSELHPCKSTLSSCSRPLHRLFDAVVQILALENKCGNNLRFFTLYQTSRRNEHLEIQNTLRKEECSANLPAKEFQAVHITQKVYKKMLIYISEFDVNYQFFTAMHTWECILSRI